MKHAVAFAFAASVCLFPHWGAAQDAAVYTAGQAQRGAALYATQCAACHGVQLEGIAGPALTGPDFQKLAAAQQLTAKSLLERISRSMPLTAPGKLQPEEYAVLVAFILSRNGKPAGAVALSAANAPDVALATGGAVSGGSVASQGVYTPAQMASGKAFYSDNCLQCHGGELEGVEDAPPLAGKPFLSKWGGLPVGSLHAFIDKNMPPGNGGALGAVSEAAVVAYILSKNNFPPGATALPADPAGLNAIVMK